MVMSDFPSAGLNLFRGQRCDWPRRGSSIPLELSGVAGLARDRGDATVVTVLGADGMGIDAQIDGVQALFARPEP